MFCLQCAVLSKIKLLNERNLVRIKLFIMDSEEETKPVSEFGDRGVKRKSSDVKQWKRNKEKAQRYEILLMKKKCIT